jgi:hypothetical protein
VKLNLDDIVNKHKGEPCVVALHGPSLNLVVNEIQESQKNKGFVRISVNEWYDYFETKPDYWVVSSTEFTIRNSIIPNAAWDQYFKWPKNVFNEMNVPLLFNETADLTDTSFIENYLKCDYLPYDAKHFKNRNCKEVLQSFRDHFEKHQNFDFKEYGDNSQMWQPLSLEGAACHPSWAKFAGAWSTKGKCCSKVHEGKVTTQEMLQKLSGASEHLGPGVSVAFQAIIFALLMGCGPIYIAGLDLEVSKGYAKTRNGKSPIVNHGAVDHWTVVYKKVIQNDLRILKETADLMGTEIINLNQDPWYGVLPSGKLK